MATIETEVDIDAEDKEEEQQSTEEEKVTDTPKEGEDKEEEQQQEEAEDTKDGDGAEKAKEEEADNTKTIDDTLKQTKDSVDEATKTLSDKGIDYNALSKEYEEKGALSDDTYKKLADAGFPKAVVDTYIRGIEAANEGYAQAVYAAAGGQDEYAKVQAYVASKGKDSIESFNEAVMNGSVATMKMIISGIKAEMQLRNGTNGKTILGKGGSAAPTGYSSEADMVKAMDDPRYGVDEDYTEKVTKRLAKSKFITFGRG